MDFVEICNVCTRKVIIKAAKRIFNCDKICRNYCDFYFGVTVLASHCICVPKNVVIDEVLTKQLQKIKRCMWFFASHRT